MKIFMGHNSKEKNVLYSNRGPIFLGKMVKLMIFLNAALFHYKISNR
jgi:hypothetical protein